MLTAALAVLCALLVLVLLVQRPAIWPVLVVLAVLWFALFGVFRYRVRSWVARWVCGGSFEKSKTQFSLEPLSQPAALLSGETVLWYNTEFRTRLMKGEAFWSPGCRKCCPASTCRRHARSAASCSIWPTACGALTAPPSPARPRA